MSLDPRVERTCRLYEKAISSGEEPSEVVGWLASADGVLRPAIWRRLRSGGVLPPYNTKRVRGPQPYIPRDQRRIPIRVLPPTVNRDPCPRCGVRRDIGCGHSLAPLGMVM